jgi:dTDP-4-dehydrorhamnose reductase
MKILITGANGQLAKEFIKYFVKNSTDFIALSKEELNITDLNRVFAIVKEIKPDIVINCAAYNLVDKAESNLEYAVAVNTFGVVNLSLACQETGSFLIHYSSDYVFDGTKGEKYTEEDNPNPINEYGKSKLLGEIFIKKNLMEKYLILRVSWVYGYGKQNFLYKLQQWATNNDVLKIAVDEFSVPTSTRTIVDITMKAIDAGLTGLYHLVNSGYGSRYEWAKEYFRIKGINKLIYPAYQSDFNLPAKRPKWSVMSNEKISKELKIEIKEWQEELKEILTNL